MGVACGRAIRSYTCGHYAHGPVSATIPNAPPAHHRYIYHTSSCFFRISMAVTRSVVAL